MRTKTVKRYYCDHCNRGRFHRQATLDHEARCIRNPDRKCRTCEEYGGEDPTPMPQLLEAYEKSMQELRKAANGCPTCILAAIVQMKEACRADEDPEDSNWEEFDYKKELRDFIDEYYSDQERYSGG